MSPIDTKRIIVLSCLAAAAEIEKVHKSEGISGLYDRWDHLISETEKRVKG